MIKLTAMDRKHFYEIPAANEKYPYLSWHIDPKLRRYIYQRIAENCLPSQVLEIAQILVSEVQELDLNPQDYPIPAQNLSGSITAFLAYILFSQRRVRIANNVELLQHHFHGTELQDVYQLGLIVISHPSKFLRNFQPHLDWYGSLCVYIHIKFQKSLTDELRRIAGDNFKRTNLGLLYRRSSSSIETTLKQLGEKGEYLDGLLLLHQCFVETVQAKKFTTNNPQASDYDALLIRYQNLKKATDVDIVDRVQAQKMLQELSNTIRNSAQSRNLSLNAPIGEDDTGVELQDIQADSQSRTSLENDDIKASAIELIRQNSDRTLFLLYGLGLTQADIGKELNCNQTTVSRQRDRYIATLAKEFYLGYHNLPATTEIAIDMLDAYIYYIKTLCEDYYAELAIDLLAEVTKSETTASIRLAGFVDLIEARWQFKFKPNGCGLKKVDAFVIARSRNSE